jgi:hypothetical protein
VVEFELPFFPLLEELDFDPEAVGSVGSPLGPGISLFLAEFIVLYQCLQM